MITPDRSYDKHPSSSSDCVYGFPLEDPSSGKTKQNMNHWLPSYVAVLEHPPLRWGLLVKSQMELKGKKRLQSETQCGRTLVMTAQSSQLHTQ